MAHETLKRIILEKYAEDNYLVLGNKNTEDCCGVGLEEALDNMRKQMKGANKR